MPDRLSSRAAAGGGGGSSTNTRHRGGHDNKPSRGYSNFSKMHLSDLFQRRQRSNGSEEYVKDDSSAGRLRQEEGLSAQRSTMQGDVRRMRSSPLLSNEEAIESPASDSLQVPGSGVRATNSQMSNTRRRLSSIFGPRKIGRRGSIPFFSGSGTPYDEEEERLDPLLTEIFAIPNDVAAFREALMDDEGQHEPPSMSSIWPSVGGAIGKLGVGGAPGAREGAGDPADEQAEDAASALIAEHAHHKDGSEKRGTTSAGRRRTNGSQGMRSQDSLMRATQTVNKHPKKVGRIAAASDFAPIHERTGRRRAGRQVQDSGSREGFLYKLVRFPLLISIFLTIALEFLAYVLIRQLVNLNEYLVAWRGHKGKLRNGLRRAETAEQWREAAFELDNYLGYEAWKREDASGLYDWILVKKVVHSLKTMQQDGDVEGVMNVLDLCLRNNFAGTENFHLYSETFLGTKHLIESYLVSVEEALQFIKDTDKITPQKKRAFYKNAQKNMGRSALCLSGGACFGYYHVGVVRALLDANLLPNIITGTSAGGLIAALACTRTNHELDRLLVPELADRITACEETIAIWGPRVWKTGARFDTVKWAEKCAFFTLGSLTFAEAFARTGKVLNISVIPADRHSPVKLLNHYTAPNCIIWSSLLASAAVPGIMNPVCLMQKTRTGEVVPWNWGHRFKDGSLRSDIPLQDLHSLFNVNYPIVSQVNPHVHLFFFAPKGMPGRPVAHRKGKGWRGGFLLSASEHVLKLHLSMNFKIIRDLDLLPRLLGQDWSSVFLQRFSGAVTIWPKTRAWDWVRLLSDPDRKELARMMRVGASVTFPKLHMIENRVRLEKAIQEGRRANRKLIRKAQHHAQRSRQAQTDDNRGKSAYDVQDRQAQKAYRSSGEYGSAADLSASGYPSAADGFTQSDTDGYGDDFFSAKPVKANASSSHGHDQPLTSSSPPKHMRRLHKQLANGFSSMSASGHGNAEAATPSDVGDHEGLHGHARLHRQTGYLTPGQTTPGELGGRLPRHIRERSYTVEEGDSLYAHNDENAVESVDHELPSYRQARQAKDKGSTVRRARSNLNNTWSRQPVQAPDVDVTDGDASLEGYVDDHAEAEGMITSNDRSIRARSAQDYTNARDDLTLGLNEADRATSISRGQDSDGSSSTSSSGAEDALE